MGKNFQNVTRSGLNKEKSQHQDKNYLGSPQKNRKKQVFLVLTKLEIFCGRMVLLVFIHSTKVLLDLKQSFKINIEMI